MKLFTIGGQRPPIPLAARFARCTIGGILLLAAGCAAKKEPLVVPHDGATEVVFDNHLPDGFRVSSVKMLLDGEPVATGVLGSPRSSIYRARMAPGDHTLQLVVLVQVPCGLAAAPYETLTARIGRSFEVGAGGGLVHVDAFAQSAWLHPSERVHLLVSLRGMREGRWLYGRSKEAREACGRLGRIERSRCVVRELVERSRTRRDIAGLLCQKSRLEAIDDAIAALDEKDEKQEMPVEFRPRDAHDVETRAEQLEREAEFCATEDLSWMGEQEVTSDRSACTAYDEP